MKYLTITNFGNIELTDNLYNSFKKLNISDKLHIVCFDDESYKYYSNKCNNVSLRLLKDMSESENFGTSKFNYMMKIKIEECLKFLNLNESMVYVDADIYFYKDPSEILKFLFNYTDFFIQNDAPGTPFCAGFFGMKNTAGNIVLLNNVLIEINKKSGPDWWCDQNYLIHMIDKMKKYPVVLPREYFPNGHYAFNENLSLSDAYIIHANYVVGKEDKIKKLKEKLAYDQ